MRARDELRAAVEAFDHLGATPWSEAARAELAATGETARRRDVTTLNDLTPRELQIALSLARGRTTRETAGALFLSPKTIEYHLRSVYRKLSIGSRSELKAAIDLLTAGLPARWRSSGNAGMISPSGGVKVAGPAVLLSGQGRSPSR
jgi:DNA-binding CsgD family transcriptional regulator